MQNTQYLNLMWKVSSYCGCFSADKDDKPDISTLGPSGRPDDPHMQVDQAADDHPAPKAG